MALYPIGYTKASYRDRKARAVIGAGRLGAVPRTRRLRWGWAPRAHRRNPLGSALSRPRRLVGMSASKRSRATIDSAFQRSGLRFEGRGHG